MKEHPGWTGGSGKEGDDLSRGPSAHGLRRVSRLSPPPDTDHVQFSSADPGLLQRVTAPKALPGLAKEKRTLKKVATGLATFFSIRNLSKKLVEPKSVKLENTYKMSPDRQVAFQPSSVEQQLEGILADELTGMKYDEEQCKEVALVLADTIKQHVKDRGFVRHKLVCNVLLGQTNDQGIEMSSRGLWDPRYDSWACASYKNDSMFAVAMVHALFVE